MRAVFGYARYLVLVAVVALLAAALAVFVFGGVTIFAIIAETFQNGDYSAEGARFFSVELIELIDLFLLGTVLLITAIGLYQLFIQPHLDLPEWLFVTNLEQLKFNLLAVIVVMLAVLFTGEAAGRLAESANILQYGLSVAAVLAAIAVGVHVFGRAHAAHEEHLNAVVAEHERERNRRSGCPLEPGSACTGFP